MRAKNEKDVNMLIACAWLIFVGIITVVIVLDSIDNVLRDIRDSLKKIADK